MVMLLPMVRAPVEAWYSSAPDIEEVFFLELLILMFISSLLVW